MKCVICDGSFFGVSFSAPAEPCECGQELSAEAAQDISSEDMAWRRRKWQREQDGLPAEERDDQE